MFGEHRYTGESPRFPSPWQQALSDPSINIKVSPIPSPFLTAVGGAASRVLQKEPIEDPGKQDESRSEDDEDPETGARSYISSLFGTSSTSASSIEPPWTPTPTTPPHPLRSQQSLILSPSRNGSTTKLVAERDKTGHIEYKLKLDAKVGGERFERLVTQLRWRLTEGGGEAMYELGILDDGTLVGIPRPLMESSLRTLELMAAELGATVMVLRVINLTSPPQMSGKLQVGLDSGPRKKASSSRSTSSVPPPAPPGDPRMTPFQQEKARRANLTGNRRGMGARKVVAEPHVQHLTAKQRKRLDKRRVYDSESESQSEHILKQDAREEEVKEEAEVKVSPIRTLEVDGRTYGPDEDWPVLQPDPAPASWKERNLAQFALASTADGKWKAKREYGQAEKELIRRERRERKRSKRKPVGPQKVDMPTETETDGWGMFDMDPEAGGNNDPDQDDDHRDRDESEDVDDDDVSGFFLDEPTVTKATKQRQTQNQHRIIQKKGARKMRRDDERRCRRKESRRLDLLRGDGTGSVLEDLDSPETSVGGFRLGLDDQESTDEEVFDVRGVIRRVTGGDDQDEERDDPNLLAVSPTKTIQARSPRTTSVFALPSQHASTNEDAADDPIPSPADTITLPMDNLSLSFSHAEVRDQDHDPDDDQEADQDADSTRLCVEVLVIKKLELEDRMYLDFSCLG